ncbi:MAG: UpxY family transcription antiterminator [Prevotellaceae bacterium]|nr:UpxY family transcription antiterminator [Prevotellaceae bacterium]
MNLDNTNVHDETTPSPALPWYALRLFTYRPYAVRDYLQEKGLNTFIPESYRDYEDKDGHHRRKLEPVVNNLLFVERTLDDRDFRTIISQCTYPVSVLRKSKESQEYALISASEMHEFQLACNSDLPIVDLVPLTDCHLKAGDPVIVHHGPLKGFTGRLVRVSKKYYLLKETDHFGLLMKVSRWCCQKKI